MYNTIVDNNLDFEHMLELPRTLFYQQTSCHQLLYAALPHGHRSTTNVAKFYIMWHHSVCFNWLFDIRVAFTPL